MFGWWARWRGSFDSWTLQKRLRQFGYYQHFVQGSQESRNGRTAQVEVHQGYRIHAHAKFHRSWHGASAFGIAFEEVVLLGKREEVDDDNIGLCDKTTKTNKQITPIDNNDEHWLSSSLQSIPESTLEAGRRRWHRRFHWRFCRISSLESSNGNDLTLIDAVKVYLARSRTFCWHLLY